MHERQLLDCHGLPASEYGYEADIADESPPQRLDGNFDVRYISTAAPGASHRFMVTMINRHTGTEELVDMCITGDRFIDVAAEIRKHYGHNWEIFEWFDPDIPF